LLTSVATAGGEEESPVAPPAVASPAPAPSSNGSVFVDPLGFLLFGPTVGAEVGFGQYSVLAYGRWLDSGVVAKALFESDTDKFTFSYGAGLRGRYYLRDGLVGPHMGVALEVLKTRTENTRDRIATSNLVLVPELEAGYRLGFGSFFVGGTIGVGYAAQVSSQIDNINGGNQAASYQAEDYSTIYGSANLDVGLLF
jgi:hypothetical protein